MTGFTNELKISVVVPAYNAEKYLGDCIRSVINQTYVNWELVLIDDGSNDQSGEIADRYKQIEKRIKVIHKDNAGVSAARNLGIDMSTGDYVMFLDADDELTSDCMETLLNIALANKADIVAGRTCGELSGSEKKLTIWRGEEAVRRSLMDDPFTYSACAKLIRKDCIGKTRFVPELRINEDSYFVFQLLCKEPMFVGIEKEVYFYRENQNSASRAAFSDKFFDVLHVADLKKGIVVAKFPEMEALAKNMQLKARMNLLHILALRTKKEYHALEKELLLWVQENKKYYISATRSDDRWFFVVSNHLYYVYKYIRTRA